MSMNREEAIRRYESIDDKAKAQLLGRLCFDLTIEFRSITSEPMVTQSSVEKLQGINEVQHKALSQKTGDRRNVSLCNSIDVGYVPSVTKFP